MISKFLYSINPSISWEMFRISWADYLLHYKTQPSILQRIVERDFRFRKLVDVSHSRALFCSRTRAKKVGLSRNDTKTIDSPTNDEEKKRIAETLHNTSLRSFGVAERVELGVSLTYLIRLFSARTHRSFCSADANYAISSALSLYDCNIPLSLHGKESICPKKKFSAPARKSSRILLAPINLLKTSDKKVGK